MAQLQFPLFCGGNVSCGILNISKRYPLLQTLLTTVRNMRSEVDDDPVLATDISVVC